MSSPRSKKTESALVTSATALESGLEKWEELVAEAKRLHVSSDKTLHRAKTLLEECAACERELAGQLHAFVSAMQEVQARQQTCMGETLEVAQRMQDRIGDRNALLERFAALGTLAGEINEPVGIVMDGIARNVPAAELLVPLGVVAEKTEAIVADADSVAKEARDKDWLDIAKEADALKQQVQSVKNKVMLAHRSVASRAPS